MQVNPLGQQTGYVSEYAPQLLFPIVRAESRSLLGLVGELPFHGVDVWTGYELSWLDLKGKPIVAVAEFFIPCCSEFIIESKSFKLYLNSLNQSRFASLQDVEQLLAQDLSRAAAASVSVNLRSLQTQRMNDSLDAIVSFAGRCIDDMDISVSVYHPEPELLREDVGSRPEVVTEALHSHLLKTNCPVTGQPDWASIEVSYTGAKIPEGNLLRYLISFREHQDFHEHCVERIFCDILRECAPTQLSVYARYTRRGGLDINPYRSTDKGFVVPKLRLLRQ